MADSKEKVSANKFQKMVKSITGFFGGVKAEFQKIVWPTREDVTKQTTVVVVVSVIVCALIAVLDYAFGAGMNFLTSL